MPRYTQLEVITEAGEAHPRRWRVLDVTGDRYLVQALFSAPGEPGYGWWSIPVCEGATVSEHRQECDQVGTVCWCGSAYPVGRSCRHGH